jgi:uncharacterized protein involved in exopolysaccharide biosynthesis
MTDFTQEQYKALLNLAQEQIAKSTYILLTITEGLLEKQEEATEADISVLISEILDTKHNPFEGSRQSLKSEIQDFRLKINHLEQIQNSLAYKSSKIPDEVK